MKTKKLPQTLLSGLMAAIIALVGFGVSADYAMAGSKTKPIIWRATSAFGNGLSYHKHSEYFAKRVKVLSNGRLIIQMNSGGSIVPVFNEQEAVNRGSVDLCTTSAMYLRGKIPAAVLMSSSMFAFKPQEFMAWCEYGGGYELWQEMYDAHNFNVKVLPSYCVYGTESLGWYRKPIKSVDDFKGMKYRTCGEWGEVVQKLGASVITIPGGELYTALERGVLDGTDMSCPSFDKGLGLYEVCKYCVFPGVHQTSGALETLVNKDKWNALPPDLQQIVIAALRESTFRTMTKTIMDDAEAVEFFKQKGVNIVKLSPELIAELKELTIEVQDARAKKYPFYGKVLQSQRDFHEKWISYERLQSWE